MKVKWSKIDLIIDWRDQAESDAQSIDEYLQQLAQDEVPRDSAIYRSHLSQLAHKSGAAQAYDKVLTLLVEVEQGDLK